MGGHLYFPLNMDIIESHKNLNTLNGHFHRPQCVVFFHQGFVFIHILFKSMSFNLCMLRNFAVAFWFDSAQLLCESYEEQIEFKHRLEKLKGFCLLNYD